MIEIPLTLFIGILSSVVAISIALVGALWKIATVLGRFSDFMKESKADSKEIWAHIGQHDKWNLDMLTALAKLHHARPDIGEIK